MLMALESDLRRAPATHVDPAAALALEEAKRAAERWRADRDRGKLPPTTAELLDYLDLSELLDVLDRNSSAIGRAYDMDGRSLRSLLKPIRRLVPIRNRVCHARPLEPGDYAEGLSTIETLLAASPKTFPFADIEEVRQRIAESPDYPLTLTIPEFWRRDLDEIPNNLPVPEYDDTGFIGRKSERESVLRLLYGAHRVVTITGEGGIGKTSLALQTLYDVASDSARHFDHIVWVTLKTATLTSKGVREIADALTTPEKMLERVALAAGDVPQFEDFGRLIDYVHEMMRLERVLLAIDNFETIDRDTLRPFFLDLPATSKVLITSRYGLGEFETRYALSEMTRGDAVRLLRSLAHLLNAPELQKRSDAQLAQLCEALFFNPLAIRWFVQSYSEGRSIGELLERRRSLSEVLDFCFHTLYESLSEDHRRYLRILVTVGRPLSEVQIALIAGASSLDDVRSALHYLHSSNLVRRTSDDWATAVGSLWTTSDFARAYISGRDSRILPERKDTVARYRALMQARDQARDEAFANPFGARAIDARSTDEASVVYLLRQALDARDSRELRRALDAVEKAKHLQPAFYEVWRVSGQVKAEADPLGAQEDFERALELDGHSNPLLVFVADFLIAQQDAMAAAELLEQPASREHGDPRVVAAYARALGYAGNVGKSLDQFRRITPFLPALAGSDQVVLTTQYVEMLRKAADIELDRKSHAAAMHHYVEALDLVRDGVLRNSVDRVLMQEARSIAEAACVLVARTCSSDLWEDLSSRLVALSDYMSLSEPRLGGADMIAAHCQHVTASDSFRQLFGAGASGPLYLFGDALEPVLGRDYTFIRGDDGRDYFLHRTQLAHLPDWDDIGKPSRSRIRFRPGEPRPGKSPPAISAVVLKLGESVT
jgi:LuxR family transcriptional regulator, glucitol operon activator